MKFDFSKEYIKFDLKTRKCKYPIPCYLKSSKNPEKTETLVIFVNGLNGTKQILHYMPSNLDYAHVVSYDARNCGENKNQTTVYVSYFVRDLKEVISKLKEIFAPLGIKHYILVGESFGSAVSTLFFKHYQKQIDACLIWNMPKKIVDIVHAPKKVNREIGAKLVWSFITNLPTYSEIADTSEFLINNRIYSLTKHNTSPKDNRNAIVAWLATRSAWTNLFYMLREKKIKTPLVYVSTKDDALIDEKQVANLEKWCAKDTKNNIHHLDFSVGKHCLLMDDIAGVVIVDILNQMVNNIVNNKTIVNKEGWQKAANQYFSEHANLN